MCRIKYDVMSHHQKDPMSPRTRNTIMATVDPRYDFTFNYAKKIFFFFVINNARVTPKLYPDIAKKITPRHE